MLFRFLAGLTFHTGDPIHRTEIRAWVTSLGYRPKGGPGILKHRFVSHLIAKWYGVSYKDRWFFGFTQFEKTTGEDSLELPSYVTREEKERYADYDNWPLAEDDHEKDSDNRP